MTQNLIKTIALLNRTLVPDFRLMPINAPDCPVFLVIAWPASDTVTGLRPRLPAGRGLTLQQALVAAGAEALELRASLAHRHLTASADPLRENGLAMVAATDLHSGVTVLIPAQEVYLECAATLSERLFPDARSTGCAVGATLLDAIDLMQPGLFWWLTGRDRQTLLLGLTTDIGVPVVAAVSSDPDGSLVAVGAASWPMLADAALAAVTEMIQTQVGMEQAQLARTPK